MRAGTQSGLSVSASIVVDDEPVVQSSLFREDSAKKKKFTLKEEIMVC